MNRTIKDMKNLGVYKPEFNEIINIYAGLVHQYSVVLEKFEEGGYQFETETAAGNPKKSGVASALETLRKDILQYSDRLCLSPRSIENVTAEVGNTSVLSTVLSGLEGGEAQ